MEALETAIWTAGLLLFVMIGMGWLAIAILPMYLLWIAWNLEQYVKENGH
ncbi:hypothetical protein LHV02_04455 [Limosilactobacillus fermentum]|nr:MULTISPECIES: hypothetical protein [Lactobacillaceae]MBC9022361.1 hypothetical protein [Limosilactobacillus fermentum CECT 5716]MCH5397379.1 hypothetical protein [Limosilactobacillus fermentum]